MKLLQATVCVVFLLAGSTSNASVLEGVCHSVAIHYKDADYGYCIKFFQADQGSATADQRGLAGIGAKMVEAAAKSTGNHIATLLSTEKDQEQLKGLVACAKLYLDAIDEIDKAVKGIASGTDGGLGNAVTALGGALDAPWGCEGVFKNLGKPSPLNAEDAKLRRGTSITMFVTWMLLKQPVS